MNNIEKYLELPHRETITGYDTLQTKSFDYQKTEIMSNKKQTAVDIAIQKCYQVIVDSRNPDTTTKRGGDYRIGLRKAIDILEELKEMEKQQILDAHIDGQPFATCISQKAEQYYNEIYGICLFKNK